jgi:hypothetical protein
MSNIWEKRNVCYVVVVKPEGSSLLGGPSYRWKDNITIFLK